MNTSDAVRPIVLEAGSVAADMFRASIAYTEKDRYELVSDADKRIERMLTSSLRELFPDHGTYGEESGEDEGDGTHRWIVDPIDGTAYFLCGVPYFSVCVSLEVDGRISEAFVYNPISDEFYHGCADPVSASLNGVPIKCSSVGTIQEAKIGVGFSANRPKIDKYFADWGDAITSTQKAIALIAPALSICAVARGRLDAFLDSGSSMEGHAGAALILMAAGGFVRNYDLTEWDHRTRGIVAASGSLADSLVRHAM